MVPVSGFPTGAENMRGALQNLIGKLKSIDGGSRVVKNSCDRAHLLVKLSPTGTDPEILKTGGALCRPPWLADEENFRSQMI